MSHLPHRPRGDLDVRPFSYPLRYYMRRLGGVLLHLVEERLENLSLYLARTLWAALPDAGSLVIDHWP